MDTSSLARRGRKKAVLYLGLGLLLVLGVGISVLAFAEQRAAQTGNNNTVTRSGAQVSIDPNTGQPGAPSDEDMQKMTAQLQQLYGRTTPVTVTQGPNGMLKADLPDDYMETLVVTVNPDGSRTLQCVSAADAPAIVNGAAAAAPGTTPVTAVPKLEEK